MADFEIKDDSFQLSFNPENINGKFPTIKFQAKEHGEKVDAAIWVRHHEKYGYTFSGPLDTLRKVFAIATPIMQMEETIQQPATPPPAAARPADRKSLVR